MTVEIRVRARAHGPEGTANRLHRDIKRLLEDMGYTLDGAMSVSVAPVLDPYPENVMCCCGELIHPDMPNVTVEPGSRLFHWNDQGGGHSFDALDKYPT